MNDIWSDFLEIDGDIYNIPVLIGIKRNADFLDKYAERTDDGEAEKATLPAYGREKELRCAEKRCGSQ